ncbi:MAG: cytochrome c oxidase subunit II [Chitinophagaceae bacterium]|jgi:cytochrome c oxidase subunit 2|nr:cytochrome c oxidase subunit II [Chitinophagaceae bacterium]
MFFIIAVIVLFFLVVFQIAKASEYVQALKGEEASFKQHNKVNGFLMIGFLVLGLIGVYWCHALYEKQTLFPQGSSSKEGERVDDMLRITITITGIVFFITQILLFWFAYRFQYKENRKAFFFSHSSKLEIIWTTIPTIVLTILIIVGLHNWFIFTSDAPKGAMQIEVTGKQFGWIFRYPGKDGKFGQKYYRNIDESAGNDLGLIWKDSAALNQKADPATYDDIIMQGNVYLIKDKPVELIIGSRDVVHDVGLPHFRMKMDAVPGMPTRMWFTPKYTTKEMKERTGNPDFVYELCCDQMCGNGHYSMRAVVNVVTELEFDEMMAKQKPAYLNAFPDKDPNAVKVVAAVVNAPSNAAAPAADTTKK